MAHFSGVEGIGVVDAESYRFGFEAALDVVLEVLRARVDVERNVVKEIEEIAQRVRTEKATRLLEGILGP